MNTSGGDMPPDVLQGKIMKRLTQSGALAVAALSLSVTSSHAADAKNGQVLAKKCTVCHGKIGVSNDPEVPNLAGQSAFYIEKALKDYRQGTREDRRMTLMAKPLEDADIKDLAAWYASIKFTAEAPE